MSIGMSKKQQRESFHHGNVAREAVTEGLALVEKAADGHYSLRELAAKLGVAHRAITAQFGDKAGLDAAIAACGFQKLCKQLEVVGNRDAFLVSFVSFALDNPGLYRLMMQQGYSAFEKSPMLRTAADRVIAISVRILAENEPSATIQRRAVMRLWMLSHGAIALQQAGVLMPRSNDDFIREFLAIVNLESAPSGTAQEIWKEIGETDHD